MFVVTLIATIIAGFSFLIKLILAILDYNDKLNTNFNFFRYGFYTVGFNLFVFLALLLNLFIK